MREEGSDYEVGIEIGIESVERVGSSRVHSRLPILHLELEGRKLLRCRPCWRQYFDVEVERFSMPP